MYSEKIPYIKAKINNNVNPHMAFELGPHWMVGGKHSCHCTIPVSPYALFKVISQKQKLPMNLFETFHECSLPSFVSKNTIKMIGHHSHLRDVIDQSYPIYACTRKHARYSSVHVTFCGSSKHSLFK